MKLFVSGYGGGNADSIAFFEMGSEAREAKALWADRIKSPSYLTYHGDLLFGITEMGKGSKVYMFKNQGDGPGYKLVDSRHLEGDGLCHLDYLPRTGALVGSCYGSGHVFSIKVEDDGFGDLLSHIKQENEKGGISRAHSSIHNGDESIIYSANIALDRIYLYDVDKGNLREREHIQLDIGEGPRHLALDSGRGLIYVITEYSNKIIVIGRAERGFDILQSISTLPDDFSGESFCSTLCFSQDGRFLYAANRGSDTIAIFMVEEDGLLKKIGHSSCFGHWPRHMDLIGKDKYIAIANERSNEVVIARRDEHTGLIIQEINRIGFKKPSFVG